MTTLASPRVLDHVASPEDALTHFRNRLRFYTDPHDLEADLREGETFTILFCADRAFYERHHIPGSEWLHYREITAETAEWPRDKPIIVYGKGGACNVGPKAAVRLAELGYAVKEVDGGMARWITDGCPVAEGAAPGMMPATQETRDC